MNNFKFEIKYCRPNADELGHSKIFVNDNYVGYIIQMRSKYRTEGNNWVFAPAAPTTIDMNLYAPNRKVLIERIKVAFSNPLY